VDENSYKKYDLSESGKLSALILKVGEQLEANHPAPEGRVVDHMTKLEVMGKKDKTIKSYRGLDCQALYAYRFGRFPWATIFEKDTAYLYEEFWIMFGRYIGDPLLYLDLAKDDDVDLKITNDFGITYWEDGQLKYTIHEVFLPDDTPAELGYLRDYEHSYWDAVSGGTESKRLTPGYQVARILLRGPPTRNATTGLANADCYNVLREVSVDFLNKKEIIIDSEEVRDLMYIYGMMAGGPWTSWLNYYQVTSAHYIQTHVGYRPYAMVTEQETAGATTYAGTYDADEGPVAIYVDAADRGTLCAHGMLPYDSLVIPFDLGFPNVPLLDTEAKKPVYIRVKSNTANGDVYLVVEELGSLIA
jgi:hypothetical protein